MPYLWVTFSNLPRVRAGEAKVFYKTQYPLRDNRQRLAEAMGLGAGRLSAAPDWTNITCYVMEKRGEDSKVLGVLRPRDVLEERGFDPLTQALMLSSDSSLANVALARSPVPKDFFRRASGLLESRGVEVYKTVSAPGALSYTPEEHVDISKYTEYLAREKAASPSVHKASFSPSPVRAAASPSAPVVSSPKAPASVPRAAPQTSTPATKASSAAPARPQPEAKAPARPEQCRPPATTPASPSTPVRGSSIPPTQARVEAEARSKPSSPAENRVPPTRTASKAVGGKCDAKAEPEQQAKKVEPKPQPKTKSQPDVEPTPKVEAKAELAEGSQPKPEGASQPKPEGAKTPTPAPSTPPVARSQGSTTPRRKRRKSIKGPDGQPLPPEEVDAIRRRERVAAFSAQLEEARKAAESGAPAVPRKNDAPDTPEDVPPAVRIRQMLASGEVKMADLAEQEARTAELLSSNLPGMGGSSDDDDDIERISAGSGNERVITAKEREKIDKWRVMIPYGYNPMGVESDNEEEEDVEEVASESESSEMSESPELPEDPSFWYSAEGQKMRKERAARKKRKAAKQARKAKKKAQKEAAAQRKSSRKVETATRSRRLSTGMHMHTPPDPRPSKRSPSPVPASGASKGAGAPGGRARKNSTGVKAIRHLPNTSKKSGKKETYYPFPTDEELAETNAKRDRFISRMRQLAEKDIELRKKASGKQLWERKNGAPPVKIDESKHMLWKRVRQVPVRDLKFMEDLQNAAAAEAGSTVETPA